MPRRSASPPISQGTLSRKQVQDAIRKRNSLRDSDVRGEDLSGLAFDGMDLRNAKLAEADLSGCSFRQANLSGASLWNANLQDANLDGAILEEADLDFANLDGCTIRGARIRKAIFPVGQLDLESIQQAAQSGSRLRMESGLGN